MSSYDKESVMAFHKGGKVSVRLPKPLKTKDDLCLAYTPGVGKAVLRLDRHPEEAFDYTAKGKTVAVVSDGTAILGLGDRGPTAAIPVMEGKCVLFKSFDQKLDILEELLRINVERIDEKRGILHTRRHLAATPIFKGIPNFRQTRIAMLRAETMDELLAILEDTRKLLA